MNNDNALAPPVFGTFYYLMKRGRISETERRAFDTDMFALSKAIAAIFTPNNETYYHTYDWAMAKVTVEQISDDPAAGALIMAHILESFGNTGETWLSRMEPRLEDGSVKIDTKADIRVAGKFRGWGGGRFIMSHAIRWAKAYHNSRRVIGLYLKDSDRKPLLVFYEPFGLKWQDGINRGDPVLVSSLKESLDGTYFLDRERVFQETWKAMSQMRHLAVGRTDRKHRKARSSMGASFRKFAGALARVPRGDG